MGLWGSVFTNNGYLYPREVRIDNFLYYMNIHGSITYKSLNLETIPMSVYHIFL